MKKTIIVILVLALLLLPIVGFIIGYDMVEGTDTVVGEVMYSNSNLFDVCSGGHNHYLFLRPMGVSGGEDWILFHIAKDTTDCETGFSDDITEMPELAIGVMVEIRYKKNELKTSGSTGYETLSIKRIDKDNIKNIKNPTFSLRWSNEQDKAPITSRQIKGTVIHVAKIDSPKNGYIFYVYYDLGATDRYWFDEESNIYDDIYPLIESGEIGYTVEIAYEETFVFYNRDIQKGHIIRLPIEWVPLIGTYREKTFIEKRRSLWKKQVF